MLGRALLRTALLLWLAHPTLQGGTGYRPQNGGLGQMLKPSKGYSLHAQNANAYQPNTKAQGYGPAAPRPSGNGVQAPYKGYGAVPAALGKGSSAKANGYGNGGKPNGYGPAASKGQGPKPSSYGASPFTSNGQQAKPSPIGGYGSKPNKPGYGAQPSYGGFGAGMRMAQQMATKGRGGYGKGNGFGHAESSFTGYRTQEAAYPQAGDGLGRGYANGGKAAKLGYGGGRLMLSGHAAKPNGYGPGAVGPNAQGGKPAGYGDSKGPKAGHGGYPKAGGIKGPKPGYGQRPSGYGGYPTGGAKGPKPGAGVGAGAGFGVYNGGASNGQGPKPNGYGPVTNGNEKGPKGKSLNPEMPSLPSGTGYTKGVVQPAEPEPTVGLPTVLPPTKGMPLPVTNWKGPKPQLPVVPQGYPSKPIVSEQAPVNKASKPVQYFLQGQAPIPELAPHIHQGKAPKPAFQPSPEIPQGNPQKPVAPAVLPFAHQEKAPKPVIQVPQPVAPGYPQGNGPKPVALQPAVPPRKSPKLTGPVLLPVLPQTNDPKPVAPGPENPQTKDPRPAAPEPAAQQTAGPLLALEATPVMPQMKSPKVANPDCGLGVSGQWTKLPSPGYGAGGWYPNSGGAKPSKPGPGYGPKAKQPGYANPGAGYGYGNGGAGPLPYNGTPIIPARLDGGSSPIDTQMAELGPEVKSGLAYGGPYGAQPMGLGSEGKSQVRYGIGGLLFSGSPMGYNSNPYGKHGNPYAAQPHAPKTSRNYNPLGFNTDSKPAAKYMKGGSLYTASDTKATGQYGPYGGQQLGLPSDTGNSGKYGQPVGPYVLESTSLGGEAKSSGTYGNPSLPFEALSPVTDGQSIDQPTLQYEAPALDGMKSVDQFGEGEAQPQPIAPLVDDVGEGPASYIRGGVRAEAASLPPAPTELPVTGSAVSLGKPAYLPVDTPTNAVTPQRVPVQQKLRGPQLPRAQPWTGSKEPKHSLKGFFGNGYHG